MSWGSNAGLVAEVVDVDPSIDLAPFIGFAHDIISEKCVNSGYTDSRLTSIETWLSAHFYKMRDPETTIESVKDVRVQYASKPDFGFKLTRHGQMALRLDTAGNLAAYDNTLNTVETRLPGKGSPLIWLGTDECNFYEP